MSNNIAWSNTCRQNKYKRNLNKMIISGTSKMMVMMARNFSHKNTAVNVYWHFLMDVIEKYQTVYHKMIKMKMGHETFCLPCQNINVLNEDIILQEHASEVSMSVSKYKTPSKVGMIRQHLETGQLAMAISSKCSFPCLTVSVRFNYL